jgi:hypothetical protein
VCNVVDKFVMSYMIGLGHQENTTRVRVALCSNTIPSESVTNEMAARCFRNQTRTKDLYLISPYVESQSWVSSLLLLNGDVMWERPVGLLIGGDTEDINLALGITTDIRMYLSSPMLRHCEMYASAYTVECCGLQSDGSACDPPVADFALLVMSSSTQPTPDRLIDIISLVNGRLLVVSRDMGESELVAALPDELRSAVSWRSVAPESSQPLQSSPRPHTYTALLLADLAQVWITRALQSPSMPDGASPRGVAEVTVGEIPPSTVIFSRKYGVNTAVLRNVCLHNRTSLLLFKSQDAPHGHVEDVLSEEDRLMLSDPSSGFYPSQTADGGVGGGGWRFIELINSKTDCETTGRCPRAVWLRGTHALAAPPYTSSIIHLAQTLLTVVHASFHPEAHPWVCRVLRSGSVALLPTLSRQEHQWSLAFISQLRAFLRQQWSRDGGVLAAKCPSLLGDSDGDWSQRGGGLAAIALLEDVEDILRRQRTGTHRYAHERYRSRHNAASTPPSVLCMEEVVLLGSTELTSPFLSSPMEADAFRQFSYAYLGIDKHRDASPATKTTTRLGPNDALRVTLIGRSENRWITNTPALLRAIQAMGVADVSWLWAGSGGGGNTGGRFLETMSVAEQVRLMRDTDILVATHGAGLMNLLYLQPHSAVVEVLTAPWYEPAYQCTALAAGLSYYALPQTNINRSSHCIFPKECMQHLTLTQRSRLACFGLRQCSVSVDVDAFEIIMWQAVQAVRILKRRLHEARSGEIKTRTECRLSDKDVAGVANRGRTEGDAKDEDDKNNTEYRKPLKSKLSQLTP